MKPSERNALRSQAKQTLNEIARLERALERLTPGTLPYEKIKGELSQARNAQQQL